MNCIKCAREIPEDALFCPYCSRKQAADTSRRRLRGSGQGSVYKFEKGWRVEIVLGYESTMDESGKLHKKRLTHTKAGFAKKQDAINYIAAYHDGKVTPKNADRHNSDITLKALYDEWFPTHSAGKGTMDCYKAGFKIFAPVYDLPMREQDIDDLQACMDESGKGRRTLENARAALGLVYKYGIPRNCVPNDRNLAAFLRIDADQLHRTQGFNDIELETIRRAAQSGDHMAQLVLCQCYTGFRPSAFITILQENYDKKNRALVGGIKTDAGRGRTVTISPKIQSYIDRFDSLAADDCIFCAPDGSRLTRNSYREGFYDLLKRLGIDNPQDADGRHRLTPHSCRHTFATLLKRVPGSDKDKLELMGHTSSEMLRHYQDVNTADLQRLTDAI